jgi:hypothetical protein
MLNCYCQLSSLLFLDKMALANQNARLIGPNLVPRACDPWEGNEGSGIIHVRNEYDWLLIYNGMLQFCKN